MKNGIDEKMSAEVKIQRGIFQGNALLSLLFGTVMTLHSHILRSCTRGYDINKSQEKIIHFMYMNDIKPLVKNERVGDSSTNSKDIYSG